MTESIHRNPSPIRKLWIRLAFVIGLGEFVGRRKPKHCEGSEESSMLDRERDATSLFRLGVFSFGGGLGDHNRR